MHNTLQEGLQRVVGKPLLSVEFIHDWLQLRWDGSFLNAYTMPDIIERDLRYQPEHPEYRRVIDRLEAQKARTADVDDDKLRLIFENSAVLTISLLADDYVGPEAINFGTLDGPLWVV